MNEDGQIDETSVTLLPSCHLRILISAIRWAQLNSTQLIYNEFIMSLYIIYLN